MLLAAKDACLAGALFNRRIAQTDQLYRRDRNPLYIFSKRAYLLSRKAS